MDAHHEIEHAPRCIVPGETGLRLEKHRVDGLRFELAIQDQQVRIVGGSIYLGFWCLIFLPVPLFDTAYMSTLLITTGGLVWVLSILFRNPRRVLVPAVLTLCLLGKLALTSHQFSEGFKVVKFESQLVIQGVEAYKKTHGSYPPDLESLAPRLQSSMSSLAYKYAYFPKGDGSFTLVTDVSPFTVIYLSKEKQWIIHIPD